MEFLSISVTLNQYEKKKKKYAPDYISKDQKTPK